MSSKGKDMTTISVIVGSTRQGRFSEKPAQWILQQLQKRAGIEARFLDLRDFPMPFFDQAVSPATPGRAPYENEVVKRWTAAIAASDGFIFVTPEYNYSRSAAPAGRVQDEVCNLLRVRDQRQVTGVHLDRRRPHTSCKETLQLRRRGSILLRHGIPRRPEPPRDCGCPRGEKRVGDPPLNGV